MSDRADLGVRPTPLEPAPRLGAAIGLLPGDLWVKRDDLLGHGGGGNKLRKLEHLCAAAIAAGATVLVTSGAAQSNHARLTAAAGRRLGLEPTLVLRGDGTEPGVGNLVLAGALGARVVWAPDVGVHELDDRVAAEAERLRAAGERPFVVPYGGSDGVGARGYVDCGAEIARADPGGRHVVVAVGSGGTMAGLVARLGARTVLGVDSGAVPDPVERVRALVDALAADGRAGPGAAADLRLRCDQVGAAYEARTDAAMRAILDAGRLEGLLLDPVYTGKALAGLAAAVADGDVRPGERTVFVHTGGLPGLLGHPTAAELADRARPGA